MHIYSILASVMTVVSFVLFLGIVWWAYSARRKEAFAKAAQAPFVLPDEDMSAQGRSQARIAPPPGAAKRRKPRAWGSIQP